MIAFLVDADNLSSPPWVDEAFKAIEVAEGPISVRRAYGSAENLKGLSDTMRAWAIRPFMNLSLPKNTTDVSLAVDAMELACKSPSPKAIVIGSGDLDFVPLVLRLKERGIKVICVTERSKMAMDAIAAYDKVIYVGGEQVRRSEKTTPAAKTAAPSEAVPTKTQTAKAPAAKKTSAKATAAKKSPTKATSTVAATAGQSKATANEILAAIPSLATGQWEDLSAIAKTLRDGKLLAKSASSATLFKKFPAHFQLKPAGKPNQVRYVLPA